MITSASYKSAVLGPEFDPDEPGLDEESRFLRKALHHMAQLSHEEFFQLLVGAGVYTPDGKLTPFYREDAEPSPYRPDIG